MTVFRLLFAAVIEKMILNRTLFKHSKYTWTMPDSKVDLFHPKHYKIGHQKTHSVISGFRPL